MSFVDHVFVQETLEEHVETGAELCENLSDDILLKHSVAFFTGLCNIVNRK